MSNIALDKDTFFRRIRRLYSAWKVRISKEKKIIRIVKRTMKSMHCSYGRHLIDYRFEKSLSLIL